jgi:ATP-dependent helicase HrpB
MAGAAIEAASMERLLGASIETKAVLEFDAASGGVVAETRRRLGAIVLARAPAERPDAALVRGALLDGLRRHGLGLLAWGEASAALRARAGFADVADLSDAALMARLEDWAGPLLDGKRRLDAVSDAALADALEGLIGWAGMRALDRAAPSHFETPAGSRHAIDYAAEGGPAVEVRVQALFGLGVHPMLGAVPLTLRLTSPAGRPVQVTTDLPRFWAGSWADVRRDLRGRYPKHSWPEDPAKAVPTLRTKKKSEPPAAGG